LQFNPDWAVITNVSKDHFELAEVEKLFQQFAGQVRRGVVGCYGADGYPPPGFEPALSAEGIAFDYRGIHFAAPVLGRHNAENALQCVLLCERLGLDLREVSRALKTFRGIQRRLEWVGRAGGVAVIDDYAHNPAKIGAAWRALAPYFRRLIGVWRPHGFAPLALMLDELTRAFAAVAGTGDLVFILPVYYAGGTVQAAANSETLVARLAGAGVQAAGANDFDDLSRQLLALAQPGDAILLMGARDPGLPVFARRLLLDLEQLLARGVAGAG
jgi:UDP-N-acetylmuramate--alanine ligase